MGMVQEGNQVCVTLPCSDIPCSGYDIPCSGSDIPCSGSDIP